MDTNHIALWLATLSALSLFWRSVRAPNRPLGWLIVTVLVLLVAASGWLLFPESVGYLAFGLTFVFIMLPIWAHNAAARANTRLQYWRARQLFRIAAWLHPFDDWPTTPRLIRAFELAHDGRTREADALLQELARGAGNVAATANAQRLHMLGT